MTAAQQQDLQLQRRLQQDSIQLAGKTIYINPFLYWRRFDSNTDRWLREPGQLSEEQIRQNRSRFYPELAWDLLDEESLQIKDGAVEMFLKSLELISTFHPELTSSYRRRFKQEERDRRRFARDRFLRGWREWLVQETTRQAMVPMLAVIVLAAVGGWTFGASQSSCPTLVLPAEQTGGR
ncbi:MAG: hypothetical protein EBZ24_03505 [Synechococcaceae bacterium WB9_4xB_025]|nr:hypothetical protein [Synechococcaceae bacterium WB9_4xB_025]